jgi:hypothetical protein
VPQLRGVGIFICLFGFGFISAMAAFLGAVALHQGWLEAFSEQNKRTNPKFYVAAAIAPCVLSVQLLCAAVAIMIGRFVWL